MDRGHSVPWHRDRKNVVAQHGRLVLVGHRHTSRGLAGPAFSFGCLPTKGPQGPGCSGEALEGSRNWWLQPTCGVCVMGVGEPFPHSTFIVAGDPFHVGGKSDFPSDEVSENPDLGTRTQRQKNQSVMCYQIQMAEVWHPAVRWCERLFVAESNSSAFTQRQEPLAPFVLHFVGWNFISNYNKLRKPSSTRDHLNNKAEVQILFDFMIAALPGTQQPHAEWFIAHRNPLPRGTAGPMNHLKKASPFLLCLTNNKRANPEINCSNSPMLWPLSRLLLSLCASLLAGMR